MFRKWSITVNLYWCRDINLPILDFPPSEYCKKLHLPPPGDARLALPNDILRIEESIKKSLGDIDGNILLNNQKIILLVKEPYIDERRRIIVGGENLGSMYYNPYLNTHLFRPSDLAAYILLHNKYIDIITTNNLKKGNLVRIEKRKEYVVIAKTINEEYGAILERVENNIYRVKNVFNIRVSENKYEQFTNTIKRKTTLDDLIKYNDYTLYYYISRSKKFLYTMSSKVNKDVIVSYSGGKDSLVTLHLTLESGIEPILMFNNTGIELPETIETVEETAEKYNLEYEVADAGDSFWKAVRSFGPPARNYRWCCKVVKLVPFAKLTRRRWPNGALNVLGQRAYESYDRSRSPKVWRNQWAPHMLSIAPIHEWPQFLLWLYIRKYGLIELVNPLYNKGFERIGCYLCPASTLAEFDIVSKTHPELWNKWINILKKFGCNRSCIRLGLWRWLGISSIKKQLMQKEKIKYSWKKEYLFHLPNKIEKIEENNNTIRVIFEKIFKTNLGEQISILHGTRKRNYLETPISLIKQLDREIIVTFKRNMSPEKRIEHLMDILKLLYRGEYCAQCKSCELWCPTNAIRVDKTPKVNPRKCIGCLICIRECPLAELMVDKIVSSIILGKPDGWRRPGKIKRKEAINIIKTLTLQQLGGNSIEKHNNHDYATNIIDNFDKY